ADCILCFFVQAEDGIRAFHVTGVKTCALPILGYLNDAEYEQAKAQKIVLKSAPGTPAGGYAIHGEYVAELARQLLYSVYQDNIYSRGFNIYTTVNSKDQEAAYNAIRDGILDYTRRARYPGPAETLALPDGIENNPTQL